MMSNSKTEQMAALLNGREYLEEMTRPEKTAAKLQGLLVVFGASDDLVMFNGIFEDEYGVYDSAIVRFGKSGLVTLHDDADELIEMGWTPPNIVLSVLAEWCPEGFEGSWRITPDCPFTPFDIMEDGQLFCRGAVIDWTALTKGTA